MKNTFKMKNFPFLVLVVFLVKNFINPITTYELLIVGLFSVLFLAESFFSYKAQRNVHEKILEKHKELKDNYLNQRKILENTVSEKIKEIERDNKSFQLSFEQKMKQHDSKMSGLDFLYNSQKKKQSLQNDFKWG